MFRLLAQFVAASLLWGCLSTGAFAGRLHGEAGEALIQMTETEWGMESAFADPSSPAACDVCHVLQHVVLVPRGEVRAGLEGIDVPVPGNERAASRPLSPEGPPPEIAIA